MKTLKKLAFVLAALMALSCFAPMSVFAEESTFVFDEERVGYSVANVEKLTYPDLTTANDLGKMDWTVDTDTDNIPDAVEAVTTIYISDATGLTRLAELTNKGNTFAGYTFVQTKDIDLTSVANWEPIGFATSGGFTTKFQGTYDGQGHTIDNMKIDVNAYGSTGAFGIGLFGTLMDATIKNVVLGSGCSIEGSSNLTVADYRIGAIAGTSVNGTANKSTTITNCYSAATISGIAIDSPRSKTLQVGGILGSMNTTTGDGCVISYCTNAGNISVSGGNVGGIVGKIQNYAATVTYCRNIGNIENAFDPETETEAHTNISFGGIAGCSNNANKSKKVEISYCENYGVISEKWDKTHLGGILGWTRRADNNPTNIWNNTDYGSLIRANAPLTLDVVYGGLFNASSTPAEGEYEGNQILSGTGKAMIHGYQMRANGDSAVDVRFVGSIDSTAYQAVGMDIIVTYTYNDVTYVQKLDANVPGCTTTTVYNSLTAMSDANQVETFTAASLRGNENGGYLFSVVLTNIPKAVGDLTVTVVPFSQDATNSEKVYQGKPVSGIIDMDQLPPDTTLPEVSGN